MACSNFLTTAYPVTAYIVLIVGQPAGQSPLKNYEPIYYTLHELNIVLKTFVCIYPVMLDEDIFQFPVFVSYYCLLLL